MLRRRKWLLWVTILMAFGGLASSFTSLGYYRQSVTGQFELLAKRRPITAVIAAPETPRAIRDKLSTVLALRTFATQRLGLPENGSYTTYVDLNRSAVVWNVVAAPELSLTPLYWCFPFAGCVSYHGYFSEAAAQRSAAYLSSLGHDVYVGGVPAYSTLGWFDDPLLSTMLGWSETRLAELIFHELAHQRLYVPNDSAFNEAFATSVAQLGVRRWLELYGNREAIARYTRDQERRADLNRLLLEARQKLLALYASRMSQTEKRSTKPKILAELRERYSARKALWDHGSKPDRWTESGFNNAKLSSVATYQTHVKAFDRLFVLAGQDFRALYRYAQRLGQLPPLPRAACLVELGGDEAASLNRCPISFTAPQVVTQAGPAAGRLPLGDSGRI